MKFKQWLIGRLKNWKEEYLPPLIITAVAIIIYIILDVTAVSWASKEQIVYYLMIIWIPALFYTVFYLRLPPIFKIGAYTFATCSNLIATGLNVYAFIPYFDTILHTLFGYLGGYIGILVLLKKDDYDKVSLFTKVFFCFALVGCVGVLWEVCEYTLDSIFGGNSQHAVETGVLDTMQDQFCNLTGALVFVIHYLIDYLFVDRRYMNKMASLLSVHLHDKPFYKEKLEDNIAR